MSKSSSTSSLKSLGAKIGDIKWFSGRRRKGSVESSNGKEVDRSGREEEEDIGSSGGEREESKERHSEDEG
jgi:hypothetical protein